MTEVDEILGDKAPDGNSGQPENKAGENANPPKEIEVNGRKYTPDQFEQLAKDTAELTKKLGEQAQELGELRKLKPADDAKPNQNQEEAVDPKVAETARKFFEGLGFVTKEQQSAQDYVKNATSEIKRIASQYGVDAQEFAKELDTFTGNKFQIPVDKIESIFKMNHPDEYLKGRQKAIDAAKPSTPYTERPAKEGLELPEGTRPKFGSTVVSSALELIGAKAE